MLHYKRTNKQTKTQQEIKRTENRKCPWDCDGEGWLQNKIGLSGNTSWESNT